MSVYLRSLLSCSGSSRMNGNANALTCVPAVSSGGKTQRIHWAVSATGREIGNCLGYGTSNVLWRKALEAIDRIDDGAAVAVHYGHPSLFVPIAGKLNILATMFENPHDKTAIQRAWQPAFEFTDAIVVPSRFCEEMFRAYTDKPIYVCPLGVETDLFTYRPRRWDRKHEAFVWGYVGAPNARKYTGLCEVWEAYLSRRGDCRLYIKTTGVDRGALDGIFLAHPRVREVEQDLFVGPGVIVDSRSLRRERMPEIYHGMHAMLFLHQGEGFGLTGLEAMATGLPVVMTGYSGVLEYARHENAYLVPWKTQDLECLDPSGQTYTVKANLPDPIWTLSQVHDVMTDYRRAAWRGARASRDAQRFTWHRAALRLCDIVDELC